MSWRLLPTLVLIPALGACADCPPFEELPVLDPDGLSTPDQIEQIRQGIHDFASWTDVPGVCVPAVEVVSKERLRDEDGTPRGSYGGTKRAIYLREGIETWRATTIHELCHAWDADRGGYSTRHPETFSGDDVSAHIFGDRERLPTIEHFAELCELGPVDLGMYDLLGSCLPEGHARALISRDVFPSHQPSARVLGTLPLELVDRRRIPALDGEQVLANGVGQGRLVFQLDRAPVEGEETRADVVVFIDPRTGSVTSEVAFSGDAFDDGAWGMVSSDGPPLLLQRDVDQTRAWRLEASTGEALAVPLPVHGALSGWADGDRAWVVVEPEGNQFAFAEVDLAFGTSTEMASRDALGHEGGYAFGLTPTGERFAAAVSTGSGDWAVLHLAPDPGDWDLQPTPSPLTSTCGLAPLDQGQTLVSLHSSGFEDDAGVYRGNILALADGDGWWLPEGGCDSVQEDGGLQLRRLQGETWAVERQGDAWTVSRVVGVE